MKPAVPLILLVLTGAPALAQAPGNASPDLATILRNQEEMRRQLEKIQMELKATKDDNQRLRKERRSTPAAATSAAAPQTMQSIPGWKIQLEPWREDGQRLTSQEFGAEPQSDLSFDLHSRYTKAGNRYVYHGYSQFHPKVDAEYTFLINLQPVLVPQPNDASGMRRFNCSIEFRVNNNRIFGGVTRFPHEYGRKNQPAWQDEEFLGSVRLQPPKPSEGHALEFLADCWPEPYRTITHLGELLESWKLNRFQIRVKGPTDPRPRPFRRDELYYFAIP